MAYESSIAYLQSIRDEYKAEKKKDPFLDDYLAAKRNIASNFSDTLDEYGRRNNSGSTTEAMNAEMGLQVADRYSKQLGDVSLDYMNAKEQRAESYNNAIREVGMKLAQTEDAKAQYEKELKAREEAAKSQSLWGGIGLAAGAILGVATGGLGTALMMGASGMSIGSGLGTMAGASGDNKYQMMSEGLTQTASGMASFGNAYEVSEDRKKDKLKKLALSGLADKDLTDVEYTNAISIANNTDFDNEDIAKNWADSYAERTKTNRMKNVDFGAAKKTGGAGSSLGVPALNMSNNLLQQQAYVDNRLYGSKSLNG